MPAIPLKVSGDFEVYEDGYYEAELTGWVLEDKEPDQYHTEAYQQFRWRWNLHIPNRIEDAPYSTWTSLSCGPKSKLYAMLTAMGEPITGELDPDLLVGKRVKINITEKIRPDGTSSNLTLGYAPIQRRAARPAPQAPRPAPTRQPVAAGVADDDFEGGF